MYFSSVGTILKHKINLSFQHVVRNEGKTAPLLKGIELSTNTFLHGKLQLTPHSLHILLPHCTSSLLSSTCSIGPELLPIDMRTQLKSTKTMTVLRAVLESLFRVSSADRFHLRWIKIIWVRINSKSVNGASSPAADEAHHRCESSATRSRTLVEESLGALIRCLGGARTA